MMFLVYCHVIVITLFSVVILLFCSQESHIPEDALLGENLERSLKFGFERFGETLIFFVAKDIVRPWAVKENYYYYFPGCLFPSNQLILLLLLLL